MTLADSFQRIIRDPHETLSPSKARAQGCTCEFGCRACGMHESQMGACPAWNPCPMGRAVDPKCPLVAVEAGAAR